ncbi:hypothetical protein HLB35_03680 [Halomonas sp. TBZ9]|uniref:Uncharacterized protein n=1 Tax=Vreelandella azerica TaxID=2732867 RepID=A0A7Y3TYR0_9GAMM|nr:hypothetical protein [Halomonas azerica]NOG31084.1 hypothetical protein [Halomonas azerica]
MVDTGGSGEQTLFDLNGDGEIDSDIRLGTDSVVSGIKFGSGESVRRVTDTEAGLDILFAGDGASISTGGGDPEGAGGRISWRQLLEEEVD